jgi:hypothetical protein
MEDDDEIDAMLSQVPSLLHETTLTVTIVTGWRSASIQVILIFHANLMCYVSSECCS